MEEKITLMKYKSDFTCDLIQGKVGEKLIGEILEGDKVEVKSEMINGLRVVIITVSTKAVEKIVISTTESKYWAVNF